jgi:cadmium resistance protein CadD (predicted permease)
MFGHLILAFSTFAITNVDDLLLLTFYFASGRYKTQLVVMGQFLGIGILIGVSLLSVLLGTFVPDKWISLLGILPILLGIREIVQKHDSHDRPEAKAAHRFGPVFQVASVTIANGGDNIAVYAPLFARTPVNVLPLYVITFLVLTALWCVTGFYFVSHQRLKENVANYGSKIFPYFLIALGAFILLDFIQ